MLQAIPVNVGNPRERDTLPYRTVDRTTNGLVSKYVGAWRVISDPAKFESKDGAIVAADAPTLRRLLNASCGAPAGTSVVDGNCTNGNYYMRTRVPAFKRRADTIAPNGNAIRTYPDVSELIAAVHRSPDGVFVSDNYMRGDGAKVGVHREYNGCNLSVVRKDYILKRVADGGILTYDPVRAARLNKRRSSTVGVKPKHKSATRCGLTPTKRELVRGILRHLIDECWLSEFKFVQRDPGGYTYAHWWYDIDAMMNTSMCWWKLAERLKLTGQCRQRLKPVILDLGDLFNDGLQKVYGKSSPHFMKWFAAEYERARGKGKKKEKENVKRLPKDSVPVCSPDIQGEPGAVVAVGESVPATGTTGLPVC